MKKLLPILAILYIAGLWTGLICTQNSQVYPPAIVVHQNSNGVWVYKNGKPLFDAHGCTWTPRYHGDRLIWGKSDFDGWNK